LPPPSFFGTTAFPWAGGARGARLRRRVKERRGERIGKKERKKERKKEKNNSRAEKSVGIKTGCSRAPAASPRCRPTRTTDRPDRVAAAAAERDARIGVRRDARGGFYLGARTPPLSPATLRARTPTDRPNDVQRRRRVIRVASVQSHVFTHRHAGTVVEPQKRYS